MMEILRKFIYRFNTIINEILAGVFFGVEIEKPILKFIWKCKDPEKAKQSSKGRTKLEDFYLPISNLL